MRVFTYKLLLGVASRRFIKFENGILICYNFLKKRYEFYKVFNDGYIRPVGKATNKERAEILLDVLLCERGIQC